MLALLGPWDFVIVFVVLVFLFGTRRFGRMFRSLKAGGREFKRGIRGKDDRGDKLPPPDAT